MTAKRVPVLDGLRLEEDGLSVGEGENLRAQRSSCHHLVIAVVDQREQQPGPVIGQDNEHVFKEILGLSEERYSELVESKIIY